MNFTALPDYVNTSDFEAYIPIDGITELSVQRLASEEKVRIVIGIYDYDSETADVILDNIYYYDFSGKVTIDILDVLTLYKDFRVPDNTHPLYGFNSAIFQIKVYRTTTTSWDIRYALVDLFQHGAEGNTVKANARPLSDIDYLRIPQDYKMVMPLCNFLKIDDDKLTKTAITMVLKEKSVDIDEVSFAPNNQTVRRVNRNITAAMPLATIGNPFYLLTTRWREDGDGVAFGNTYFYTSPIYEVTNGVFEQYLFLNKYGAFDNIPMDGTLKYVPEYDIQTVHYNGHTERISADRAKIYSQNSGNLSPKTAKALSELLLSDDIYHYDKDSSSWKKIIIESPVVDITEAGTNRTITFKWRYAEEN